MDAPVADRDAKRLNGDRPRATRWTPSPTESWPPAVNLGVEDYDLAVSELRLPALDAFGVIRE